MDLDADPVLVEGVIFVVGFQGSVAAVSETTGVVLSVDLMSVKLRTFDNLLVRLPNETLLKSEIVNLTLDPQHPYVGTSAFAHKAGLHVSAIVRAKDAYEHVDPEAVSTVRFQRADVLVNVLAKAEAS